MKKQFINIVSYLFIAIFVYASLIKGLNLNVFQGQMMQSPIIPKNWIPFISIFIPLAELIIAILLIVPRYNVIGLGLSYSMMLFFSLYLASLVFAYGDNVPCACGGILGQLGYPIHISFNIILTIISLLAFYLQFISSKAYETKQL